MDPCLLQTYSVVPRERLYRRISEQPPGVMVWLAAAGGYGKTTLAQAYARRQGDTLIHLAVPGCGWTPADFFHAVKLAMQPSLPSVDRLPLPETGYAAAPAEVARYFASEVTACLPAGTGHLLLLDDVHFAGEANALQEVVAGFLEGLADTGLKIVIAGREEPPSAWARLRGQRRLMVLDEKELAFDTEEIGALLEEFGANAAGGGGAAVADLSAEALREACGGWVTGAVLLLEEYRRTGALGVLHAEERAGRDSLVDWFRTEVYDRLDPQDRDLLCRLALPDAVPWDCAAGMTNVPDAVERLQRLLPRHVFIHHRERGGVSELVIHDLFRAFLRRELRARLEPEALRSCTAHSGRVLWDGGCHEAGAALLIQAEAYADLGVRLNECAAEMIHGGRAETLHAWLETLPESVRRDDPVLRVWEGWCMLTHDPAGARAVLAEAWTALHSRRAWTPMAMAWTGIIDSIWLEWACVREYEYWLGVIAEHEERMRQHLSPSHWRTVLRGMLVATAYARPRDPGLPALYREASEALSGEMPGNERVMLAGQLMCLNVWHFGQRMEARRIIALIGSGAGSLECASPAVRTQWHTYSALWSLLFEGDHAGCTAAADTARRAAASCSMAEWECAAPPLYSAVVFHDEVAFDAWMARFDRSVPGTRKTYYSAFHSFFMACGTWLRGNPEEAERYLRVSVAAADVHGSAVMAAGLRGLLAGVLAEAGRYTEALREAAHARRIGRGHPSELLAVMLHTALARIPLRRGQPRRALPYIRRAFAAGTRQRLFFPLMTRRGDLAACCALALRHDICSEYATWLIGRAGLRPPRDPVPRSGWPWPARLHALGRFHLSLNGRAPDGGGGRRRQREEILLGHLVLAGRAGVEPRALAERIWPDSSPDKAYNTLCVALHRLRAQQFGDPDAVVVREGFLAIDTDRVWVDLWEFNALATDPESRTTEALEECCRLYRGELCLPGVDSIDLEMERAAAQRAFERVAIVLGQRLERIAPDRAAEHYRRALCHSRTHPHLWQGLMRCEAAVGDPAAIQRVRERMALIYREELDAEPPGWIEPPDVSQM